MVSGRRAGKSSYRAEPLTRYHSCFCVAVIRQGQSACTRTRTRESLYLFFPLSFSLVYFSVLARIQQRVVSFKQYECACVQLISGGGHAAQ